METSFFFLNPCDKFTLDQQSEYCFCIYVFTTNSLAIHEIKCSDVDREGQEAKKKQKNTKSSDSLMKL